MDNKTISYLNSKALYRALKVFVYSLLLIIWIASFAILMNQYEPSFDNNKSYILCNDGRKLALEKNNIFLYSTYAGSYQDEIRSMCAYNNDDPVNLTPDNVADFWKNVPAVNYTIIPTYISRDWSAIIGYFFIILFSSLVIVEIIKRAFYYIALGTFKPKK